MLRRILTCSSRNSTHRALCSLHKFLFLAMVATVFWIFMAVTKLSSMRNKFLMTQTNSSLSSAIGSKTNSTVQSTLPLPVSNARPSSVILTLLNSTSDLTKDVFISQKAPMSGTGQGNLMFMYASLIGIAEKNKLTPVYPGNGPLRTIFHISALSLEPVNSVSVSESKACAYDSKFSSLSRGNVTAVGYLQSWKYFSAISERLRREFTFVDRLKNDADNFLVNISATNETDPKTVLYIGVHIRRRDMLVAYNVVRGYTVATKEYLNSAVQYFRSQFPSRFLVFVVCGDEIDWAKQNFPPADNSSIVAFSGNRNAAEDMALLAACNHSIITVGSYGWWSAYLAGGRTVYYKNFPNPGSHIASIFDKGDYFPPEWIGL